MRKRLGGRGTGAKTAATLREMADWKRRYRDAIMSGADDGGALIVEAVNKWGYGTVKRMMGIAMNPARRQSRYHVGEETMLGPGGKLIEPLSESGELTFVIEILKDAVGRGLSAGAHHDVVVAIGTLHRLKEQVMHGYHRNPVGHPGVADHGELLRSTRARNPPLVVLGANPPGTYLRAKWARIEYCRPDDPAGRKVARVHDFPEGFIAHGLADGSVLLRHPQGRRLWTRS